VLASSTSLTTVYARPAAASSLLEITSKATTYNRYRGFLRIRLTTAVTIINFVEVDAYLRGVVRSRCLRAGRSRRSRPRRSSRGRTRSTTPTDDGDVGPLRRHRSQVYRGQRAETTAGPPRRGHGGRVVLSGTAVANTLNHRPTAAGPRTTRTSS
jgi:hypothetical protein